MMRLVWASVAIDAQCWDCGEATVPHIHLSTVHTSGHKLYLRDGSVCVVLCYSSNLLALHNSPHVMYLGEGRGSGRQCMFLHGVYMCSAR